MTDWFSVIYGILGTVGAYLIARIVDMALEHFFAKSLFGRIWRTLVRSVKKFQTSWHPITICFNFRIRFEPTQSEIVKRDLSSVFQKLSEENKGKIIVTPAKWTEDDKFGSINVTFNEREYRIDAQIDSDYINDFEFQENQLEKLSDFSESVAFSIEVSFPFKFIEKMLFSLNMLTVILGEQLKESFQSVRFSKGLFTVAPIKTDLTMDNWVKEKRFEVSLQLKSKENIVVNLYPKKAEIVFSTLQIDENVYEYLKATILNYYL